MAETAKMLNPRRVLLPDLQAGCSLVDACPADKLARYQDMLRINAQVSDSDLHQQFREGEGLSDWVVTSGNAEDVVRNKGAAWHMKSSSCPTNTSVAIYRT